MATREPPSLYLRAYLDGLPVDYSMLLAAVWDGAIEELDRIQVVLDRRPYLNADGLPVPEELVGYSPVASKTFSKEAH